MCRRTAWQREAPMQVSTPRLAAISLVGAIGAALLPHAALAQGQLILPFSARGAVARGAGVAVGTYVGGASAIHVHMRSADRPPSASSRLRQSGTNRPMRPVRCNAGTPSSIAGRPTATSSACGGIVGDSTGTGHSTASGQIWPPRSTQAVVGGTSDVPRIADRHRDAPLDRPSACRSSPLLAFLS